MTDGIRRDFAGLPYLLSHYGPGASRVDSREEGAWENEGQRPD